MIRATADALGLVNRVVVTQTARPETESLAAALRVLPQIARGGDRSSVYEQFDLAATAAMENKFIYRMKALASGAGRQEAALIAAGAAAGQDFGRNASVPSIK